VNWLGRELLIRSLLVVSGTALALALAEGALRVAGFSFPALYTTDEVVGSRLRPGAAGWNRSEGEAYVRISSQGLRDREHAPGKPQDRYRIAVLGDSYAEALQVPLEQTFWAKLPQRLERCAFAPGRQVEPINFGVSGYGTAQQLLVLRERAWTFSPDLVLLAFFPGNDVRNNSRTLERDKARPFFVLRDGALELDPSFRESAEFRKRRPGPFAALRDLRLYELTRKLRAARPGPRAHNAPVAAALADGRHFAGLAEPGLDENVMRAQVHEAWDEAWTVTEELIATMQREVRARGARFLLVVLSSPALVYPDRALRERYARLIGVDDLLYPETRLAQLARRHGFEAVMLGPQMQRHADATGSFLHGFPGGRPGFGHWNKDGHALAAELIARHLCRGAREL
jgi:hypothetical protein